MLNKANKGDNELSRKQQRKTKRKQKKIDKQKYYQKGLDQNKDVKHPRLVNRTNQKTISQKTLKKIPNNHSLTKKPLPSPQMHEDDKLIKLYEQKLGIKQKGYGKMAKKFGYDDDIFDFLDGISKTVNQHHVKNGSQDEDQNNHHENLSQENDQDMEYMDEQQMDEQFEEMFDKLGEEGVEDQQIVQDQKPEPQINPIINAQSQQTNRPSLFGDGANLRRSLTSLFNKLSEGNLLLTFRKMLYEFQSNSRNSTITLFCDLFVRCNVMVEKPMISVLGVNVALTVGLHRVIGNRLMGELLGSMTRKFTELKDQVVEGQIEQLGYSKSTERRKNYVEIVGLFYEFGSVGGDFIEGLFQEISQDVDLLFCLLNRCGSKLRSNDPLILKRMVVLIKNSILKAKQRGGEMSRWQLIGKQVQQMRFNRKSMFEGDGRMSYLNTFLREISKEGAILNEVISTEWKQAKLSVSGDYWWNSDAKQVNQNEGEQANNQEILLQVANERKELEELARSFHIVTETRKAIFISLMTSKDYVEATQKILDLRVKNYQDVAAVLVQVCTLEPTFNAYYVLVAGKIAGLIPKFRLNIQYALWDRVKLLGEYDLRRSVNLAKFFGRLLAFEEANCSLSMLRCFPDLGGLGVKEGVFMGIVMKTMLEKIKSEYMSRLVGKLRQQNNRNVREGLKAYMSDFEGDQNIKNKAKSLRRLLMVQLSQKQSYQNDLI